MGVPKFFRYISERYPCLSEFVKEYQIPVFDNLYLDMNGIIHMCSHPDDNNPHFRITEEKIFADIFHYIEVLFSMIKPQKVFFMAVDGVAPRAKMNQQRGRRFRSAKEAERLEKEAVRKGETLPDADRFDSNCITPGTEFMARLHEQLKYFVVKKVSTDNMWKKCKVILSGHETPGEGEHKIMDYIRYIRSQPGYDPNTRHCLYGLDADLIMLGLCTHDPHFSLLREEVKFGKKTKRSNVPEEIRFYLLHLSLMREYLELEFASLKAQLKNPDQPQFDIEKIIDDWILMGFLVGNDFIPNLPNLHIANGALPVLYKAYMEVLPTLDGYINEAGTLHLGRFEKFMKKLSEIDVKNFEETHEDLLYMEMKTGRKQTYHTAVHTKPVEDVPDGNGYQEHKRDPALEALIAETDELDISSDEDSDEFPSTNEEEAFKSFKNEYYRNKLEYQKVTAEVMREQAEGYVRAIQWNLNYYYNGVCSWSWFYPHHYSPYISDIKGFSNLKLEFELGQPFKPYEQLLAVLPTASKKHLPKCYHELMTEDNSVIKSYYPEDFQTDLNGKRQEWEAVVLVPFIDENTLLDAMKPCNERLSPEEAKRNQHGPMLIYQYTDEDLGFYEAPSYFSRIRSKAHCTPIKIEDIRVPQENLIKGAYPGASFDVFYPGFPTLKHLDYEGKLTNAKVKVFELSSRNENMVLKILPRESNAFDLLGKIVWVQWPHLTEAKVVAVSDKKQKYIFSESESQGYRSEAYELFDKELDGVTQHYKDRLGIEFGRTEFLVHVRLMTGRKYVFTSGRRVTLEKQFSPIDSRYPLQSVVTNIKVYDEHYSTYTDVVDVFPEGSTCFSLTHPYYGSQGTILDSEETLKNNQLKVLLHVLEEPNFVSAYTIDSNLKKSYMNLTNAASHLTISNYVFSRITGSLFVRTPNLEGAFKTVNIGLDLKFNKKNQETPGYTRKFDNTWYYTDKAVKLVGAYLERYPEVFEYLSKSNDDEIMAETVFETDSEEKVKSVQVWLRTLPTHNIERRVCGSFVLEPEVVKEIEQLVDAMPESSKDLVMQIKPQFLYKPEVQMGNLAPDSLSAARVFDRIVNVREGFTVPLGLKGTIIAVHKSSTMNKTDEMYDIVFDKTFAGGMAINCSEQRGYRLTKASLINLTHGKRQMEQKTGTPGALRALAKERHAANNFNIVPMTKAMSGANITCKQQNSAFASFNKVSVNFMASPSYNKGFQQNSAQQPAKSFQRELPHDQQKNKSSFHYMADFSRTADPKINKENSVYHRTAPPNGQTDQGSQPMVMGYPTGVTKPINSKPKTEVDTDFLKQILNIQNNFNMSKSSGSQPKETQRDSKSSFRPNQTAGSGSATAKLLSFYQSNSLGCPRYTYLEEDNGFRAQVALPNGIVISGGIAGSREDASENVAVDALNVLQDPKSKSLKEGLPLQFPVPPTKWVQQRQPQNTMPSQVFVNKSYQAKSPQKMPVPMMDYGKRDGETNSSRGHNSAQHHSKLRTNVSNTPNFIPLQALKKKPVNRTVTNVNRTFSGNSQCTKIENSEPPTSSNQSPNCSKGYGNNQRQRLDKANGPRKTRIAANFNK